MSRMRTATVAILLAMASIGTCVAQRSQYDPASSQTDKQHDSFVDFALKQINSNEMDYGSVIDAARKIAIEETFRNIYFWSSATCFGVLCILTCMLLSGDQQSKRRELIAARILAWYHNELVDSRAIVNAAVTKNQEIKAAFDDIMQAKAGQRPQGNSRDGAGGEDNEGLVSEINRLRQQITAHEDTEKALREQINVLGRRLQEEKQRNRTLKGA